MVSPLQSPVAKLARSCSKSPATGDRQIHAEHLLDFEALRAAPDQLVTYFFWGEDVGPDGQPRRTSGDMFFAEVRHFEEIFRQGEQPAGGSAQDEQQEGGQNNARNSDQLAELQKEIINGTWKLVRRETGCKADRQARRRRQGVEGSSAIGDRKSRPARRAAARCGVEGQPGAGDCA